MIRVKRFVVLLLVCSILPFAAPLPAYAAWSLSMEQRRAYLEYYAPLIFKRSDENSLAEFGLDWITNFDFDNDQDYSTNKDHWEDIFEFVLTAADPASYEGPHDFHSWYIGPTLYTALIEFMVGEEKQVTLLYHVYHAKEDWDIHDWERIEVRIRNVNGTPGIGSEEPAFVVITEHSEHKQRPFGHHDLEWYSTANGMHPIIWQAEWSFDFTFSMQEIHFAEDDMDILEDDIADNKGAEVEVNGTGSKKNINLVFVNDADPIAVNEWNAQTLTYPLAFDLAAKVKEKVNWDDVPRIRYELQDLADIIPSHWNGQTCNADRSVCTPAPDCDGSFGENIHWQCDKTVKILLETALRDERGKVVVPPGKQKFYRYSLDQDDPDGKGESQGYPKKHWFWGAYNFGRSGNFMTEARDDGTAGTSGLLRRDANRLLDSHDDPAVSPYMWQHDYFAHSGDEAEIVQSLPFLLFGPEPGGWLEEDWYKKDNGGFDGRWVQLFDDPVELPEPGVGLALLAGWSVLHGLSIRKKRFSRVVVSTVQA